MEKQKRRRGDRRDGRLLRELDSLHFITGIIYPNRCDNEAYISERIDLTPVQKSLTEMQRSLTEMNKLLERVGNLSEKYSCKWIRWLPDFSLLVALKWIALLVVIGAAALAGWYGVAAISGLLL